MQQLEQAGFLILPEVLSSKTVNNLITAIDRFLRGHSAKSEYAMRHLLQAVPDVQLATETPRFRSLVEAVLGPKAFVVRSIFFDKTAEANWKVAWHQDLTIAVRERMDVPGFSAWSVKDGVAHVQPPVAVLEKMLTLRLHLDDCDAANGPLQVIPGSHKSGRLSASQIANWRNKEQPFVCAVRSGEALVMRPLILHASSPAIAPTHRRVVHLEFAADPLPGGLSWV